MAGQLTLVIGEPARPVAGVAPSTVLLGLPILRRTALAARRAGFPRVVVEMADSGGPVARALDGTGAELRGPEALPADASVIAWNVVVSTKELARLRAGEAARGVEIWSVADLRAAEDFLLRGLVKDEESFMSRHVERKVSLAVSRRLAATSITPNAMTLVSVAIGLAGAGLFLSSEPLVQTAGALLFLLHSILDGCDGELARLKFQESRWGGLLDFWGDNVVHVAVFLAIATGWSRAIGAAWPLALGASAAIGTLLSAGFVYLETMREKTGGPMFTSAVKHRDTALAAAADALGRRDFIYLVIALSAFGKARWFLVLGAVGAPIFFLVLLAVSIGGRRRERAFS